MRKFLSLSIVLAALQSSAIAAPPVDQQARQLVDQGQLPAALSMELKAHAEDPKNVGHLNALTFIYLNQGEPNKALAYAQEAAKLAPGDMAVHYNLAGVYQSMRKLDEAIAEYRILQSLEKGSLTGTIGESLCLILAGKDQEARKLLENAAATHPDNADVWSNLANVHARQRNLDKAEQAADRAVRIQPSFQSVSTALKVQLAKHETEKAVESARQLMKLAPKAAETYHLAAMVAATAPAPQDLELAKAVVQQGTANLPKESTLFSALGERFQINGYHSDRRRNAAVRRNWFQLAEQCYRQAVAASPQDAGYHLQLASVLAGQDQVTEAIRQTEEARRLDPDNQDVRAAQAKLNVVQNDVARSLRNWLRAYRPLQ